VGQDDTRLRGGKDGEEGMGEKNGVIWKRGDINQAGAEAEENTAIKS